MGPTVLKMGEKIDIYIFLCMYVYVCIMCVCVCICMYVCIFEVFVIFFVKFMRCDVNW
jgi:hypothetical protein